MTRLHMTLFTCETKFRLHIVVGVMNLTSFQILQSKLWKSTRIQVLHNIIWLSSEGNWILIVWADMQNDQASVLKKKIRVVLFQLLLCWLTDRVISEEVITHFHHLVGCLILNFTLCKNRLPLLSMKFLWDYRGTGRELMSNIWVFEGSMCLIVSKWGY